MLITFSFQLFKSAINPEEIMKIIHFISLQKCYDFLALNERPAYQIFTRLTSQIPRTSCYFVGPVFTSITEAHEIAYEAFKSMVNTELQSTTPGKGPFDVNFGANLAKSELVSDELLDNLSNYRWFKQIKDQIGDYRDFLKDAKESIDDLFHKIKPDQECLAFTVFPFGEIICQEYLANKEEALIFRFLEGFSLINDGTAVRAELLH
jgi:hypothetical protein